MESAPRAIVYLNTEVNARYPAAVDRHIRVVQWNHWTRDKCRFAKPASTCIMTMWHMSVSTACLSADPFAHHIREHQSHHRWRELCLVIAYCNQQAQQWGDAHTRIYVFDRCYIALVHVTLHHMSEWGGWGWHCDRCYIWSRPRHGAGNFSAYASVPGFPLRWCHAFSACVLPV